MGLNNNIKTRSLRVIDLLNNDNLLPNNNNSSRLVAYATGLSQNDFITPQIVNKSFKSLFEEGKIFFNHIPTLNDQPIHTFAETRDLFNTVKKGFKQFWKELSKSTKVDMKLANWIKCLGDPTITVEEIQLCNKALSWTDLGHDNLDRLMRVYFNKTKFANQRKHFRSFRQM